MGRWAESVEDTELDGVELTEWWADWAGPYPYGWWIRFPDGTWIEIDTCSKSVEIRNKNGKTLYKETFNGEAKKNQKSE